MLMDGDAQIVLCEPYWDPKLVHQEIDDTDLGKGGPPGDREIEKEERTGAALPTIVKDVDQYQFAASLLIEAVFRAMAPEYFPVKFYEGDWVFNQYIWTQESGSTWFYPETMEKMYLPAVAPGHFRARIGEANTLHLAIAFGNFCKMVWHARYTWLRPMQLPRAPQRGSKEWLELQRAGEDAAHAIDIG